MFSNCITCPKLGVSCKKLDFIIELPAPELLEWCKKRKAFLGLSNAKLADLSGIPKGTIDRTFSGEHLDFKHETIRPILKVLVGGSFDDESCCTEAKDDHAEETIENLRERLADSQKKIDFLKEQVKFKEDQMIAKDKLISERAEFMRRKDRIIAILALLLAVAALVIIGALVIDRMNSNIGFFWRDTLAAFGTADSALNNLFKL